MIVVASSNISYEKTQSTQVCCVQTVDTLLLHFLFLQDFVVQHWSQNRALLARELDAFDMSHVQYLSCKINQKSSVGQNMDALFPKDHLFRLFCM